MRTRPVRYPCLELSDTDDVCVLDLGHDGAHRTIADDGTVYEFARDRWAVAMDDDLPDEEADSGSE